VASSASFLPSSGGSRFVPVCYDVGSAFRAASPFGPVQAPIVDLQFDGTKLVSASRDGSVTVWDLITGAKLYSLLGHTGEGNRHLH
jgi:WD40 repeat protein